MYHVNVGLDLGCYAYGDARHREALNAFTDVAFTEASVRSFHWGMVRTKKDFLYCSYLKFQDLFIIDFSMKTQAM